MFRKCERCDKPMGAAVGRLCDDCKGVRPGRKPDTSPPTVAGGRQRDDDKLAARLPDVPEGELGTDHADQHNVRPGEPCPTCGRPIPLTNAERQRRYRQRKRKEGE
jgi:hypothetical protein